MIVFKNNNYQQSSYINSSRNIVGKFYDRKQQFVGFMNLREVNDSLMKENALLKSKLGMPVMTNPLRDTSYTDSITSDGGTRTVHYRYIPAKVLNNTIDQKINYITLDMGSKDGIQKGMAVISQQGIVGRISHVSEHYSVALSFLSDRFNVSAMVKDSTVGKLYWDGMDPDYGTLSGIPQSVKLKTQDSVFTSGFGIFPERLLVGRAAKTLSGTSYKIHLNTNFRKLHFVYVIVEGTNEERKKLEESSQVNE